MIRCKSEEIDTQLTANDEEYILKFLTEVEKVSEALSLDFLQNQLAVSAFVVTQIMKRHRKRIFMQVPPGKGKSRMIASVVLGIV